MNNVHISDTAALAFQPFLDLSESSFANLSSQATLHWLNSDAFSLPWGAFMHFYGPTRKLLKIGGLDLEDGNFLNIHSPNPKWNFLVSKYLKGNLKIDEQIYFIRLLFYLGFYKQGIELTQKNFDNFHTSETRLVMIYLEQLGNSIINPCEWFPDKLIVAMNSNNYECSAFYSFQIALLLAKFYTRVACDFDSSIKWLNKASSLIEQFPQSLPCDIQLAKLRLDKYFSDFYFKSGNLEKAILLLKDACNISEIFILKLNESPHYLYLFKETKRRILDALTLHYSNCGNEKEALRYAKKAIDIDPYCSYALLLAGKSSINIDKELARKYFEKSAEYGVLERDYAKKTLSKLFLKDFSKALTDNLFLLKNEEISIEKLPIQIKDLGEISNNYSEDIEWQKLKKKPCYLRSLPFWELSLSNLKTPIFCFGPIIALENFKNKELPWFNTLYLQRAMPLNFREELVYSVAPNPLFATHYRSKASRLEILQQSSIQCDEILSTLDKIMHIPKLERIQFCRLLGSLGFYEEALRNLPVPLKSASWDIEDEYAFSTKLFFENIYFIGADPFPFHDIEFAFQKLSARPESLRMKFVLTMLGCVFHGKRNEISQLKKWRDTGFAVLEEIQNSVYFNEFEKKLLTSRFYRAASFYPFLINDHECLQQEAELCEYYGRTLKPGSEKEKLIYKENLFPMLESLSRISGFLGDQKRSLNLMEEIVFQIDDQDAKAWIQVGESREKNGDLKGALEAFERATNLAFPLGGISSYRAGRVCEKLGDFHKAKTYYISSLQFCPKGISPLKRLHAISATLEDNYLKDWSEKNLNHLLLLKKRCGNTSPLY